VTAVTLIGRCVLAPRLIAIALVVLHEGAVAQQPRDTALVRLVINADLGEDTISRHIYGHFAEHLGRGIYDGLWRHTADGWHPRADVEAALRKIKIPNLRWPGGCFADRYHWQDGIGPLTERPTIVNTMWGNVTEDNSFGTHEYLDLVNRLGAAPVVVGNVGSGTVREMAAWWEYVNFAGVSPMAELRRKNGREQPWNVRFWAIGNEAWGCGGNMTPEYYADVYRRFASFLPRYGADAPRAFRIAVGPNVDDYRWTETLMRQAGGMIDGLDLHYYTVVGPWAKKGSATDFGEREWFVALQKALRMEELITRHAGIMDQFDPRKRIALIVGEWGMWHDVEPGTNPGFLYQQNTLRDALVAAVTLDIFNHHAGRVRMANIAQTVNVLQSVILTHGDSMLLTPTYHVFDLYTVHHDAVLLPSPLSDARYEFDGASVPAISATASRDALGRIHVTLSNLDPRNGRVVDIQLRGARVSRLSGRILTAASMTAYNTFDNPSAVQPAPFTGARRAGETLRVALPPKCVVMLELQ
jgi:alpha-N-arabinofuranosidase